jgi:hypothetical protein
MGTRLLCFDREDLYTMLERVSAHVLHTYVDILEHLQPCVPAMGTVTNLKLAGECPPAVLEEVSLMAKRVSCFDREDLYTMLERVSAHVLHTYVDILEHLQQSKP